MAEVPPAQRTTKDWQGDPYLRILSKENRKSAFFKKKTKTIAAENDESSRAVSPCVMIFFLLNLTSKTEEATV